MRRPALLRLPVATGLVLAVCLGAAPSHASAYDQQWTLGIDAGYGAVLFDTPLPRHGIAFGADASIGLNDIWSLRARIGWAVHPGASTLHVASFGAELLYLVDVVEVVPYFGAGLDAIATIYEGRLGVEPAVHAVIGAEYLVSRAWLLGLDVRPYLLPLSLSDTGLSPAYLTITLRASLMFDL